MASTPKKALGYMYGYWCQSGVISRSVSTHVDSLVYSLTAIGSMCAPLVCQSIIATGVPWPRFYFGSLVLSGISSVFAFWAFRPSSTEIERDVLDWKEKARASAVQATDVKLPGTPVSEATIGLPDLEEDVSGPSKSMCILYFGMLNDAHALHESKLS